MKKVFNTVCFVFVMLLVITSLIAGFIVLAEYNNSARKAKNQQIFEETKTWISSESPEFQNLYSEISAELATSLSKDLDTPIDKVVFEVQTNHSMTDYSNVIIYFEEGGTVFSKKFNYLNPFIEASTDSKIRDLLQLQLMEGTWQ